MQYIRLQAHCFIEAGGARFGMPADPHTRVSALEQAPGGQVMRVRRWPAQHTQAVSQDSAIFLHVLTGALQTVPTEGGAAMSVWPQGHFGVVAPGAVVCTSVPTTVVYFALPARQGHAAWAARSIDHVPWSPRPRGIRLRSLLEDTPWSSLAGYEVVDVKASSEIAAHVHKYSTSYIHVSRGTLSFRLRDMHLTLSQGAVGVIDKGVLHGVMGSEEDAEFVSLQWPPIGDGDYYFQHNTATG